MEKDYALILAWPETYCKQTGSWYDPILNLMSIANNGYYKVGHAAVVLIDGATKTPYYYDFGRYHSPKGFGRVRNAVTDHDLKLTTAINYKNDQIINLSDLLTEIFQNDSCHGNGYLMASFVKINFMLSKLKADEIQNRGFIPYGPFIFSGTNCSRFVNRVVQAGIKSRQKKLFLQLPLMLTPTPKWNVRVSESVTIGTNNLIQHD